MKKKLILLIPLVLFGSLLHSNEELVSFEQLFPSNIQKQLGLHKLNQKEKEELRIHVEGLLLRLLEKSEDNSSSSLPKKNRTMEYVGIGGGHWISKNVDSGSFIVLEDHSLWEVDPLEKLDAMLWLPISNITVIRSNKGTPGYNYLLINTDDGEKAHAKYIGNE